MFVSCCGHLSFYPLLLTSYEIPFVSFFLSSFFLSRRVCLYNKCMIWKVFQGFRLVNKRVDLKNSKNEAIFCITRVMFPISRVHANVVVDPFPFLQKVLMLGLQGLQYVVALLSTTNWCRLFQRWALTRYTTLCLFELLLSDSPAICFKAMCLAPCSMIYLFIRNFNMLETYLYI